MQYIIKGIHRLFQGHTSRAAIPRQSLTPCPLQYRTLKESKLLPEKTAFTV